MTSSVVSSASLLAVDIGDITTRAALFDVVNGRYRFLAVGTAPTTAMAPFQDVGEGVRRAMDRLQEITGRRLVDQDERLIMPARSDGAGVDSFSATLSFGPPIRVVAVGLLEDVSLESARHLATTTYARVVDDIHLNDRRKPEERIDAIMRLRPDVIAIAGGMEDGASHSVLQLLESVGLACYLIPDGDKPEVLYAGNQSLAEEVQVRLGDHAGLHIAPNVRPALEVEQLGPAHYRLAQILGSVRSHKVSGVQELKTWAGDQLSPTATAFGRIVRFLSMIYDPAKGVLGVDVGASATTVAAAFAGELSLGVYPQLGLGKGVSGLLRHSQLEEIARWVPLEVGYDYLRDYLYNKSIYPASLPVTEEDMAIEQAVARQAIRTALHLVSRSFPARFSQPGSELMPGFEPIMATGSVLTQAPTPAQALMILLDALQPTGVTTMVLDQNNLAAMLGTAAVENPLLTVQVLESSTFLSLGTIISPIASVRIGTPVLRLRMNNETGEDLDLEVKQGSLEVIPLPMGKSARIQLQPLHRADVGMGSPGRGGKVRVMGGALGVVIDARGRPLELPADLGRRQELIRKWLWTLGG